MPKKIEARRSAIHGNGVFALRDIPADRLRMHLCWGNYPGPHHRDIPLAKIAVAISPPTYAPMQRVR